MASLTRLAIFDIDGTLTRTNEVDELCYQRAVTQVLGIGRISTDWGSYRHSTDSGILVELIARELGREATVRDLRMVRSRFVELIHQESLTHEHCWDEVPGASAILADLVREGWGVAIATGGWRASALRKLERAGVRAAGLPLACSDDAMSRLDIIRCAIRRLVGGDGSLGKSTTIPAVYIGDGRWDIQAAAAGGLGFVGIGRGARAVQLAEAGAGVVLEDFSDRRAFSDALGSALQVSGAR